MSYTETTENGKSKMKDSGFEWIGNIPSEWKIKPIKYCTKINSEVLKESTPPDYPIKYVDIRSVSFEKGILNFQEMLFENAPSRARRIAHNGDTIVSTVRTYLKAITQIKNINKIVVSTGFAVITPKLFDSGFLEYFCKSDVFCEEIRKNSYGIAYPAINSIALSQIKTFIPPIAQQTAISALLDDKCGKADAIISDIEKQIDILKRYKKSLITETVTQGLDKSVKMKDSGIEWIGEIPEGCVVKRLKHIGTSRNGLTYSPDDICENGVLVLRSSNIQNNNLSFEDNVFVNTKIKPDLIVKENDILICSRNGSRNLIGKCAMINKDIEGNTFGAFMSIFRSPSNKFIHYVLQSDIFSYYLGTFLTSTINQLTNENLNNIQVPIPNNTADQDAISAFLDTECAKIDSIILDKENQKEIMKKYKQSLIYEYVTGKRRVNSNIHETTSGAT